MALAGFGRRTRNWGMAAGIAGTIAMAGCGRGAKESAREDPSTPGAARAAAESLEARGSDLEAFESYREASRRFPVEGWAWEGAGRTARRLGRAEEAAQSLHTALRRDPGRASAHRELAAVEWERGRYDEALTACDDAMRLSGDLPELLALRARILLGAGRPVEAASMLARAEAAAPRDVPVRAARIHALLAADSTTRALEDANALVRDAPESPDALETRALVLERSRDPRAAAADLSHALELDARRPDARRRFARLLLETGDGPGAEREFRILLAGHPSDARSLEGLGSAALARGDPAAAERAFREAVEATPDAAGPHLALGKFLIGRRRLLEGIEVLRRARARASLDVSEWEACSVALADAHLALGEAANAREIADSLLARMPESRAGRGARARALAADPNDDEGGALLERLAARSDSPPEEILAYADWLLQRGDPKRALAVTEELAARDSTGAGAGAAVHARQARALAALGRTADAEDEWRAAHESDPHDAEARLGFAGALLAAGRTEEALALAQRGEAESAGDARFATLAGEAHLRAGRHAEADSALARALEADPRAWRAGLLRGVLEERTDRPQEAVRRFESMLAQNERLPEVHAALAWVLADREMDALRAESHARRAVELAPGSPEAHVALAWSQLKLGRLESALRDADDAKRLAPHDARTAYVRGVILRFLDRGREARAELRRALELDPAFERSEEVRAHLDSIDR